MQNINLEDLSNLKSLLKNKQQYRFTISDHRRALYSDGTKHYRIIDEQYKNQYDPLNYVSIDIYRDRVDLHCVRDGANGYKYEFLQREIDKISSMRLLDSLEHCIIVAVDRWNSYYLD